MHYHYFTLEQRDVLEQLIRARKGSGELLQRLHTAEYGVCRACGKDISYARLLQTPDAERCMACEGVSH